MNIFLADDDEIIRNGMRVIIEKASSEWKVVAEAPDGEIALQKMDTCEDVDLLITDIRMPIMDGLELIKRVRERNPFIKIIVLSGFDDFSYVRNAFMDGAVDYLLKPIDRNSFISLLQKVENVILQETEELTYKRESHDLMIAHVLDRLFHKKNMTEEEVLTLMKKIGISTNSQFCVMITRIDDYYKQKMERMIFDGKLEELLQKVMGFMDETIAVKALHYINKTEIVSFLFSDILYDANYLSEELHEKLLKNSSEEMTYTIGVSNILFGSEQLFKAYEQAKDAADVRFYLGRNHIIRYHEIEHKCISINYDLEQRASLLTHYLELCDYIHSKQTIEEIFLDLSYARPQQFRAYILELVDILILRVKDFQAALLAFDTDYKFITKYINTYNELKSYLNSMMQSAIEYIRNEREKRSKKRIEIAKQYILEHYKENITLNDVAEYVELNASYFSNLFKAEMAINFSDYLLNTRMNIAKKLLRDPKIKVYEIGNMVGYEDAVSFGRAFKKKIGMSPKEYRNTVY